MQQNRRNSLFWNEELECPVVYLAGICLCPNTPNTRAGYGIFWGEINVRNSCGSVSGVQSQLRAELTALKTILEIAINENVKSLIIGSASKEMDFEIDKWENNIEQRSICSNSDLLSEIHKLTEAAQEYKYWTIPIDSYPQKNGYNFALRMAMTSALENLEKTPKISNPPTFEPQNHSIEADMSMVEEQSGKNIFSDHSKEDRNDERELNEDQTKGRFKMSTELESYSETEAKEEDADSGFETPIKTRDTTPDVFIFGWCAREGTASAIAKYAVFWGEHDDRNKLGNVDGKQTFFTAELSAFKAALRTAAAHNIPAIRVRTRSFSFQTWFQLFIRETITETDLDRKKLAMECVFESKQLRKVEIYVWNTSLERFPLFKMREFVNEVSRKEKTNCSSEKQKNVFHDITHDKFNLTKHGPIYLKNNKNIPNSHLANRILNAYIGGACHERKGLINKSVNSIVWHADGKIGILQEPVTVDVDCIGAKLMSVKRAFTLASNSGIRYLIIRTNDRTVYDIMVGLRVPLQNRRILDDIAKIRAKIQLKLFFTTGIEARFNALADHMAQFVINNFL